MATLLRIKHSQNKERILHISLSYYVYCFYPDYLNGVMFMSMVNLKDFKVTDECTFLIIYSSDLYSKFKVAQLSTHPLILLEFQSKPMNFPTCKLEPGFSQSNPT